MEKVAPFHSKQVKTCIFGRLLRSFSACVTTKGDKCVFPFTYKDVKYEACTEVDGGGKAWCSMSTDENGIHHKGKYGYCIMEVCKGKGKGV